MPDLRDLMHDAVADLPREMTQGVPEQDLARARRGLTRERSVRVRRYAIPAGIAAAAAGVLAVSMLNGTHAEPSLATGGSPKAAVSTQATTPSSQGADTPKPRATRIAVDLVSYNGKQPKGFTVDKIPAGWSIQALNASDLLIAPPGAKNKDPHNFVGKIYASMSAGEDPAPSDEQRDARTVKVGDATGTLFLAANGWDDKKGKPTFGPDSSTGLRVPDGDRTLVFQFPPKLGWDDATIVDFAEHVHLTADAEVGNG